MWEQITYDIKCPRYDCEHFKKDASENPCLGCTCKYKWVEGVNRAFRYKPTGMPERHKEEIGNGKHNKVDSADGKA